MMDRLAQTVRWPRGVLHAPNDALRDNLVPLNRKYPISELLETCNRYLEHAPRDFITFEYCMLDGVERPARACAATDRTGAPACRQGRVVQVQPDPLQPLSRFRSAALSPQQVAAFAKLLSDAGIVTTVRKTRGDDIDAACGQLAGDVKDRTRASERMAKQRVIALKPVS